MGRLTRFLCGTRKRYKREREKDAFFYVTDRANSHNVFYVIDHYVFYVTDRAM